MRIISYGTLHHKNRHGLDLVAKHIPVIYLNTLEGIKKYDDGETLLFINDRLDSPNFSKIINGPGIDFNEVIKFCKNYDKDITINMLSPWLKKLAYHLVSKNNIKFIDLPFPVDIDKFIPSIKEDKCFLYFKHVEHYKFELAKKILDHFKKDYKIFIYGNYSENEYLNYIKSSKFGIWVGSHESQGFAFQEALSSNCPLFVLDVNSLKDELNHGYYPWRNTEISHDDLEATSASYWDDSCGIICKNFEFEDIVKKFNYFLDNLEQFEPRKFVEKNLTCEKFIERLNEYLKK